jgi:hypothetical protein
VIIKTTRKIQFMLDLTALEARFRNLSLFGCKAAGGKVLLFYLSIDGMEKNTAGGAKAAGTGRSGTLGYCGWLIFDC